VHVLLDENGLARDRNEDYSSLAMILILDPSGILVHFYLSLFSLATFKRASDPRAMRAFSLRVRVYAVRDGVCFA